MPVVQLPEVDLFYADDGQGPPIVWLQGLGADQAAWTAQVFAFHPHYRCLRPDNRGVGQTRDRGGEFTIADLARDVVGLLDHLSIEAAHVVGLSLGGAIAQSLAIDYPERVRALVLVATFARRDPWGDYLLRAWVDLHRLVGQVEFYRQTLPWLVTEATLTEDRKVRTLLTYAARHSQSNEDFARQARAALAHNRLADLPRITAPTLVVRGAQDLLSPEGRSREIAAAIPTAHVVTIPDGGHSVNLEQQSRFNQAVREFLGQF